jgi:ADP-ribosylglycohydrolase
MTNPINNRGRNLVIGALVADAAAMGLHWIYDQDHIQKIAPDEPEFRAPDAQNYDGIPGYFAHPTRKIGDLSQYGEQVLVMLSCLMRNGGDYDAQAYGAAFRAHFGYGGAYVGYIDHATRDTLDNFRRAEDEVMARATALPFDGSASVTGGMVSKAKAMRTQFSGELLRQKYEEMLRASYEGASIIAHGLNVLDAVLTVPLASGATDQQLPATAKLPPLIAALAQSDDDVFQVAVASAVKTTSDHERAASFGQVCAAMMRAAVLTGDLESVVEAGRAIATPETEALLADAMGRLGDGNRAATRHFGMACDLNFGVPSVLHNVMTATSFTQAIRRNIYAGGDNCGRAILVGAIMGAIHGVGGDGGIPQAWIDKLSDRQQLAEGLDAILN